MNAQLYPYGFASKSNATARKIQYNAIFAASDDDFVSYWESHMLRDNPEEMLLTFERLSDAREVCR